jgi:hypothetical protein
MDTTSEASEIASFTVVAPAGAPELRATSGGTTANAEQATEASEGSIAKAESAPEAAKLN